jgi:hypothetical protein
MTNVTCRAITIYGKSTFQQYTLITYKCIILSFFPSSFCHSSFPSLSPLRLSRSLCLSLVSPRFIFIFLPLPKRGTARPKNSIALPLLPVASGSLSLSLSLSLELCLARSRYSFVSFFFFFLSIRSTGRCPLKANGLGSASGRATFSRFTRGFIDGFTSLAELVRLPFYSPLVSSLFLFLGARCSSSSLRGNENLRN